MKRVRVNKTYVFNPNLMDIIDPHTQLKAGDIVKVVNRVGCPKANVMGQCYVEKDGKFMGMVSTASLDLPEEPIYDHIDRDHYNDGHGDA